MSNPAEPIREFVEYARTLKGDEKGEAQVFWASGTENGTFWTENGTFWFFLDSSTQIPYLSAHATHCSGFTG